MKKHAYLIMAHNQKNLLCKLVEELDDYRNDLFIHIDKKFIINNDELKIHVSKSNIYFVDRISVNWGGGTLIRATLKLLENSTSKYRYQYYHLLSGQDFPLKSQDEIHRFFDIHDGLEFISCKPISEADLDRVKFYYYFQDLFGGRSIFNKVFRKVSVALQHTLGIDRTKYNNYQYYGIGSQWFSITDKMARYIVRNKISITKDFANCFCADEIFLQTVWLNSPFYDENIRYHSNISQDVYIQEIYHDVLRAIDWYRGNPYTYDERDYEMLMKSTCLFARKMSEDRSMKLIHMIESKKQTGQKS